MCQKLAAEAEQLAAQCTTSQAKQAYLDLKRHWEELAAELEELGEPRPQQTQLGGAAEQAGTAEGRGWRGVRWRTRRDY
jgi:hypothetical protein